MRNEAPSQMSTDSEHDPANQPSYGKLSAELREQLASVTPSVDHQSCGLAGIHYHPCRVRLHDGTCSDRVMVVEQVEFSKHWKIRPAQDHAIKIEDVAEITDSPSRLPWRSAVTLYRVGETLMGGYQFGIRYQDGSTSYHTSGNVVDFPKLAAGKSFADIKHVVPEDFTSTTMTFEQRKRQTELRMRTDRLSSPDFMWCLYSR